MQSVFTWRKHNPEILVGGGSYMKLSMQRGKLHSTYGEGGKLYGQQYLTVEIIRAPEGDGYRLVRRYAYRAPGAPMESFQQMDNRMSELIPSLDDAISAAVETMQEFAPES